MARRFILLAICWSNVSYCRTVETSQANWSLDGMFCIRAAIVNSSVAPESPRKLNQSSFRMFLRGQRASQKIPKQFNFNVFGVIDATRAILPAFRTRKSGAIITVGSRAAFLRFLDLNQFCWRYLNGRKEEFSRR
jgi:NAD(P)-dependent dehydrogenase (short-subunit alcohol dehydrogenase family)